VTDIPKVGQRFRWCGTLFEVIPWSHEWEQGDAIAVVYLESTASGEVAAGTTGIMGPSDFEFGWHPVDRELDREPEAP
jgi:hypothetical protein